MNSEPAPPHPPPLAGELAAAALENLRSRERTRAGGVGGGGRPLYRRCRLGAALICLAAVLVGVYLTLPAPALDRSRSVSMLALARDGSILRGFLSGDGKWRLPVTSESVDPLYRDMLIAIEDQR